MRPSSRTRNFGSLLLPVLPWALCTLLGAAVSPEARASAKRPEHSSTDRNSGLPGPGRNTVLGARTNMCACVMTPGVSRFGLINLGCSRFGLINLGCG